MECNGGALGKSMECNGGALGKSMECNGGALGGGLTSYGGGYPRRPTGMRPKGVGRVGHILARGMEGKDGASVETEKVDVWYALLAGH
jgi:hypothetical protein